MALRGACLLLLWQLALWLHCATSLCNVTCSTDYDVLLNCSCSDSAPTHPVQLQVSCSDNTEEVNGSCEVQPPRSWCVMHLEDLYLVASVGTLCKAAASRQGQQLIPAPSDSSVWALSEVVKPQPPLGVHVTNADGFYNITWAHNNTIDCLTYRLRIRESRDLSQSPVYSLDMATNSIRLQHNKLQPHSNYTVDVQAKICVGHYYQGPWSEWSRAVEWRTSGGTSGGVGGIMGYQWYISLTILPVICLLWLCCIKKQFWLQKLHVVTYIPKPDVFFQPLYKDHGGNFQEWVKPAFREYEYLTINSRLQAASEEKHDVLQWSKEKKSYGESGETKRGGRLLQEPQPHAGGGGLLLHFQDDGCSQGTGHSVGHVSIHTVTLSGEEFEDEVASQVSANSLRCYQDGESFGSFEEDNREHPGFDFHASQQDRQSGTIPPHENHTSNELPAGETSPPPHVQVNEPERLSLDSFASNGQSEDGYPQVDLDTIDSGFMECGSPGASDSDAGEQTDLFQEHKNSNSNYVKQWMICNTVQEATCNADSKVCDTH